MDPTIKAIFFDLCGVVITLADDQFCKVIAQKTGKPYDLVMARFKYYLPQNERGEISEATFYRSMFADLDVSFDVEEAKKIRTSFRVELPGIRQLIEQLKKKYTVGFISNDAKEMAGRCNAKFGFDKLFHLGFLAHQIGARKDSPRLFETVLEKVKCRPEECIFLDDTAKNLVAAKNVGFHTIHYLSKKQLVQEFKQQGVS